MNINSIGNVNFNGLWRQTSQNMNIPRGMRADNLVLRTSEYHPFKDERISDEIINSTGRHGAKYFEYNAYDDNFGNEDVTLVVEDIKIGKRLDITEKDYNKLLDAKEDSLTAKRVLSSLGSNEYKEYNEEKSSDDYIIKKLGDVNVENLSIIA